MILTLALYLHMYLKLNAFLIVILPGSRFSGSSQVEVGDVVFAAHEARRKHHISPSTTATSKESDSILFFGGIIVLYYYAGFINNVVAGFYI